MPRPALGLIEVSGIDGAIQATRAASEAGQVVIVSAERSGAERMTVKIEGDWSAVQKAVEAGARAADKAGQLLSMHVIPRSDEGVSPILPYPRFVDRYHPGSVEAAPKKKPTVKPVRRAKSKPAVPATPPAAPIDKPAAVDMPMAVPAPPFGIKSSDEPAMVAAPAKAAEADTGTAWAVLEAMAVVKLRKYARSIPELPIKGREISKANKSQLLEAIASVRKGSS